MLAFSGAMMMLMLLVVSFCEVVLTDDIFTDTIRYEGFPVNTRRLSQPDEPRIFYIRNNLKGNVEFRESENVTIEVFISGKNEDRKRFQVHYNMLGNNSLVDLQVWLKAEELNWPLIGGLAGGGFVLLVLAIIVICVCIKRRNEKKSTEEEEIEMKKLEKGKNVRACSPKCSKATYQQYGCGLTFDRKCVARAGSKVLVPNSAPVLMENRLRVRSTNYTFQAKDGSSVNFTLHRNSGFVLDVEVFDTHLTPKYLDYAGSRGSNNPAIASVTGFSNVRSGFCRFPAQEYYELTHRLLRERQTMVKSDVCKQANINLCPTSIAVGEKYYYRAINDPCKLATSNLVCKNAVNCNLPEPDNKLYCTHYVAILSALFAMDKDDFEDKSLYEFDSALCKNAFITCNQCRKNNCSQCVDGSATPKDSCSCCYKDCLSACETYYTFTCASRLKPKRCATGDVSEFELKPTYSNDLRLRFNCYVQHDPPSSLYTVRYRVRHQHGTPFISEWISKTQRPSSEQRTNILDSLEIFHSSKIVQKYYMRAQRNSLKEKFRYSVAEMGIKRSSFVRGTKRIQPLEPFSFHIGDKSWKNRGTCNRLEAWQSMIVSDFTNFTTPQVRHLGPTSNGDFAFEISDPASPPSMRVQISDQESILKYIFNNSVIVNDESFQSSIARKNSSWVIQLKGKLRHCPSVIGLVVIDELDNVKVIESDLLVLCPDTKFNVRVQIPRRGLEDRERLFTVFLTDSKQEYKLQAAVVDKTGKTTKEKLKETNKDTRREPWIILAPLFITTGCVLVALAAMMIYAQKTVKQAPKMEIASADGWVWVEDSNKQNKDKNRLKRRHLILVVFVVVVRVVYSLVFTFSMAFAILTLLHADNMKIINDYRAFVQRKVDASKSTALRMDQFREKEIKSSVDQAEDVQKACDYHLGVQLKWLQYNMSCTLQTNHLKMFNKISEKVIDKVTAEVKVLEQKVKSKMRAFSESTRHKLSSLKDEVENYGRRVYDNKWFLLPKGAYQLVKGRKKRAIDRETQQIPELTSRSQGSDFQIDREVRVLSRVRRSFSGNTFIGFLDFVGVLDQNRLSHLEKSINEKIESMTTSFNHFKKAMASGTPPFLPISAGMLCPVRFLGKTVKGGLQKGLKLGLKGICEKSQDGIQKDGACLSVNISNFCSSQDVDDIFSKNKKLDSSSQRVYFEKATGVDSEHNVSAVSKSSVIEGAQGNSHYNVEKGDAFEEQIDSRKEERLKKQGQLKELGSIFDAQVFITIRTVVIYVLATIDILLFVYRCLKTYQIVMKLLYGFEQTVEHDPQEFHDTKVEDMLRRTFDIAAKSLTKFIAGIKNLQKKVVRTNILPMLIIIALGGVTFYLIIVITFNVMNVTVIEELGGYRMVSARLDADLQFTNGAIADHIKFLNDHDMKVYKESVTKTIQDYNKVLQDFSAAEKRRFEDFNARFCSITNRSTCSPLVPEFPKMSFSSCVIPRFSQTKFEGYNGKQYRYKLKYESKKYVDAVRNIFLDTLYFIIGAILAFGLIAVCVFIVFYFMKSKDMIRIKHKNTEHLYLSFGNRPKTTAER
ncbi:hypothetical protein QZH41_003396 [Actinostola sp. cb2023]|nr:hypothetical protein QZH41_003396 [Actinostola sp. cb2023]